jgi:hypothetical protein
VRKFIIKARSFLVPKRILVILETA